MDERGEWIKVVKLFNGYLVFTNGSKIKTGTILGVYISAKNLNRLTNNLSVFSAEITRYCVI